MKSNVYNRSYQEKQAIYSHYLSLHMHETEILCITHKHPPSVGGMEKQSYELINGLK